MQLIADIFRIKYSLDITMIFFVTSILLSKQYVLLRVGCLESSNSVGIFTLGIDLPSTTICSVDQ